MDVQRCTLKWYADSVYQVHFFLQAVTRNEQLHPETTNVSHC